MIFNFPDDKTVYNGTIHRRNARNFFELIDISNPQSNLIEINGTSYYFTYFNGASPGNKGGNSIILKLYESQTIDLDELEYGDPELVLKISKIKCSTNPNFMKTKEKRFLKEIRALKRCEKKKFENIIRIFHYGKCRIKNQKNTDFDEHFFYTMEYADKDLKSFIEDNHNFLSLSEKVDLCISLSEGLKELVDLNYYHRDIKPDNIFIVDKKWKIGDLGLIAERNSSEELDELSERIGPIGWLSPEAMNKYLCEKYNFAFPHNCTIDHQSDIFQLGKVFWYIFQHNAPIGSIKGEDFLLKDSKIYAIIRTMLNHSKSRRFKNINEVIRLFHIIQTDLLRKSA